MLSKNKTKLIASLSKKKAREKNQLFVAEGDRLVTELLATSTKCELIVATEEWLDENEPSDGFSFETVMSERQEIKQVSQMVTPQEVLGVFEIPNQDYNLDQLDELVLFLDQVQDPGNLGTIMRIADWFGIKHVFCAKGTVDVYSNKVVQATMGAIATVAIHYVEVETFFMSLKGKEIGVFGTFIDGDDIYKTTLPTKGVIVLGNEGNGISPSVESFVTNKLCIPSFNEQRASESLNVATAASIVCSEFLRKR